MSTWRVERHYGFGAAQIPIQPEPHRAARIGFAEGLGALVGELTEGGVVATMRRAAGEVSAILLSLLIFAAVIMTLLRDHSDMSSIDVVLLETVVPKPQPLIEDVEELAPVPAPVPIEVAKPAPPKPPPQRIAERPKPVPPPIAKPKPKRMSRPKPVIPEIARVEMPKPRPVEKLDRSVRERPQQIARPRVAIDAARVRSEPEASTPRMDRIARAPVARPSPTRSSPRMDTPAAPAFDSKQQAPPKRAFRLANTNPAAGKRPLALPAIVPAAPQIETPPIPQGPRSARTASPRPQTTRSARRPAPTPSSAPALSMASVAVASPERSARVVSTAPARRAPRPTAQVARVREPIKSTLPTPVSRSGRAAPEAPRGSNGDRTDVAGVPLGALAACLSDRDEDRLKQAVVAAVTTQQECVSRKGIYRFIETKNLNAFLMWIDRAPARPIADRCVELGYALECLQSAGRRAAR
jgi:hypothetical protein